MVNSITLISDYRGAFYSSTTNAHTFCSMDVEKLAQRFEELGWDIRVIGFPDIDFAKDWTEKIVIYQSAEDPSLEYHSYIEDIVLGLTLAGARVIPDFPYLHAHHNKLFMEILRKTCGTPSINNLSSSYFGTFEDFLKAEVKYPLVAKPAGGAGSKGIKLIRTAKEAVRVLKQMSRSPLNKAMLSEIIHRLTVKKRIPYSIRRQKFVLQEFIPKLSHDYKVLVYGNRFYVLRREVRANDFRASGSGLLSFKRNLPEGLLDFALEAKGSFDTPNVSLDIAVVDGAFYLIEMQFIQFGPYTLEHSSYHWERQNDEWKFVESKSELEETFAESIHLFANEKGWLSTKSTGTLSVDSQPNVQIED